MRTLLFVAFGGGIGSALRYLASNAIGERATPWSTISVNIAGSLVLGLLVGWFARRPIDSALEIGLLTGVLGGFTTFSTFTIETVALFESGRWETALLNVAVSVIVGLAAAAAGLAIARAM